jgi:hypothetical protein
MAMQILALKYQYTHILSLGACAKQTTYTRKDIVQYLKHLILIQCIEAPLDVDAHDVDT